MIPRIQISLKIANPQNMPQALQLAKNLPINQKETIFQSIFGHKKYTLANAKVYDSLLTLLDICVLSFAKMYYSFSCLFPSYAACGSHTQLSVYNFCIYLIVDVVYIYFQLQLRVFLLVSGNILILFTFYPFVLINIVLT